MLILILLMAAIWFADDVETFFWEMELWQSESRLTE